MVLAKKQRQNEVNDGDAAKASAADSQALSAHKLGEKPQTFLVTTENSKKLANTAVQALSPVQSIQDRLQSEFSADDSYTDPISKDLRLAGVVFAIAFSVTAWTLILQLLL